MEQKAAPTAATEVAKKIGDGVARVLVATSAWQTLILDQMVTGTIAVLEVRNLVYTTQLGELGSSLSRLRDNSRCRYGEHNIETISVKPTGERNFIEMLAMN